MAQQDVAQQVVAHLAVETFFLERAGSARNFTPNSSPFTRMSPQRRETRPDIDNTRKNSLRFRLVSDSPVARRAPLSEMSNSVQARRHEPSMPMMWTGRALGNWTRSAFRLPQLMHVSRARRANGFRRNYSATSASAKRRR